jgi:hypothetical protein
MHSPSPLTVVVVLAWGNNMESYMPHGDTFADLKRTYRVDRIQEQRPVVNPSFPSIRSKALGGMVKLKILHVICQLLGGRDGCLATASLTVLFTS